MKLTTKSILISLGAFVFAIIACISIMILSVSLVQADQPATDDPAATIQAIITQTKYAMTQNAPTSTPVPATVTPVPATNTPLPTATGSPLLRILPFPMAPNSFLEKRLPRHGVCRIAARAHGHLTICWSLPVEIPWAAQLLFVCLGMYTLVRLWMYLSR